MNEKTAYEQTIAARLQALPLPDMADAIWARIEAQLDIDMPPDNGTEGGNTPNFPTGGFFLGGISLIVVAVLYLFFSQTKKPDTPQTFPSSTTTPVSTQPVTTPANGPPALNTTDNATPAGTNAGPANQPLQTPVLDSNTVTTAAPPILIDSSVLRDAAPLPTALAPVKTDTVAAVKKGRGVSGITNDDYRIVPKKDSSKNK